MSLIFSVSLVSNLTAANRYGSPQNELVSCGRVIYSTEMDKNRVVARCYVSNDSHVETAPMRVLRRTRNCLQVLKKKELKFQSSNRDVELSLLTIIRLGARCAG